MGERPACSLLTCVSLTHPHDDSLVQAFPVVSILPVLQSAMVAIGFQGSTIYDIPNVVGTGSASVNAVRFEATCYGISGLSQAGAPVNQTVGGGARIVTYPFHIDDSLLDVNVTPGAHALGALVAIQLTKTSAPSTLTILAARPANGQDAGPSTLLVAASGIQITDDAPSPSILSTSSLTPQVVPDPDTCAIPSTGCGELYQPALSHCD